MAETGSGKKRVRMDREVDGCGASSCSSTGCISTESVRGVNLDDLQKDLDPSYIKERPGPRGARLYYLSGGDAVDLANRIFGPHRWSVEVTEVDRKVHEHSNGTKYSANITSKARVTVFWEGPGGPSTFHEDVGCGGGDVKKFSTEGEATELAAKEASTDAIKRALRFFGRALGGCFYDKEYLARIPQLKRAVGRKDEASRALLRPLLCKSTVQHLESGQTTLSLPSVKAQVVSEPTGGGVESAGKEEDEYYDDFDSDVEF
ncbi:hypothetical protein BHE90_017344 [Fusarium euwallaceae]|uniref:DNA repair and recombination protein RAD52 n=1 Tax=Fusarium euwallaceae TaxID=1147111 RepID=A0A430KXR0_9HYPO|nr:hypothetical protein BHE90_017344 [Fusarium euwallaceae]